MISAYAVASAGFLLLGGRAADLLGRRRVFVAGLALYAGASLGGGLASGPELLLVARAVHVFALVEGPKLGWDSPAIVAAATASVVALGAFALVALNLRPSSTTRTKTPCPRQAAVPASSDPAPAC